MFLRVWPSKKYIYIALEVYHIRQVADKLKTSTKDLKLLSTDMALSRKVLSGSGYVILNVIRGLNIIGLLMIIAACIVLLVKTSVHSRFFFFDAVSHVFETILAMFLVISEMSLFRGYFERNWPLLSPSHGFSALALAMIIIGTDTLGNLNAQAESQKALGMPFWQLVICSGIVIFILGWINLVATFVFCDRKQGITARQVRAHGAVAALHSPKSNSGSPCAPELAQSYISQPRTPTKLANPFRILTTERRNSGLPSYHSSSPVMQNSRAEHKEVDPASPTSRYSRATACTKKKVFSFMGRSRGRDSLAPPLPINPPMEISGPIGINPQFAHLVKRPDSALHPSRTAESDPYRWHPAS